MVRELTTKHRFSGVHASMCNGQADQKIAAFGSSYIGCGLMQKR
jgi:hypothetical protein